MTPSHPEQTLSAKSIGAGERPWLLVVDDQPEICRMVSLVLGQSGWNVIEVASGADALAAVRESGARISLALIDMVLPDMAGSSLALRLREFSPALSVVMVSGWLGAEMISVVSAEGYRFLPKPFTLDELTGIVRIASGERPGLA